MSRYLSRKIHAAVVAQTARERRARQRCFHTRVERLEDRNLMAGGSVVLAAGLVTITPASTGPNTAIVSYQNVSGTKMLDVSLNGSSHYFGVATVGFVYYEGSGVSAHRLLKMKPASTRSRGAALARISSWAPPATTTFSAARAPTRSTRAAELTCSSAARATNVFNENAAGTGDIIEVGSSNTVNVPPGSTGTYYIA